MQEWLTCGPLKGVRDSQTPGTPQADLARDARNMYVRPGPVGGGLFGRPGYEVMGTTTSMDITTQQSWTTPQGILSWTDANGVNKTTLCADGVLWDYDWSSDTWTNVVTAGNLTTASVVLSTTAPRVSLVPFAGKLMISDGVNDLVTWTGASGAGGIAQIANVGPFVGPLTVYYAKLFGILKDDAGAGPSKTLAWSEENDPTLGWNVAPYNNAWDNPGGYTEPLKAVCGTNDALYVFRQRRIIAITGAVDADFQTAGTRANVSEITGTLSPWAVGVVSQGVMFLDEDAAPHLIQFGAVEPVDLWLDCVVTTRETPRLQLAQAIILRDAQTEHILVGLPQVGATAVTRWLAFHDQTLQYAGFWECGTALIAGEVEDNTGLTRWAHVNATGAFAHGLVTIGPFQDETAYDTIAPIPYSVTTPLQGYELSDELRVDALEASVPVCTASSVTMTYETARGAGSAQVVNLPSTAGGFMLDQDFLDDGVFIRPGGASANRRAMAWCHGRGRGVQATIRHQEAGRSFGVDVLRVRTYRTPGHQRAP